MKSRRPPQFKTMTRKGMLAIARELADCYPGKKLTVLMPGDPIPAEFRPKPITKKIKK
tara:strand:- start:511 stop:684 length:174 start_codon:yes stop_codon:yes gene_type:complete